MLKLWIFNDVNSVPWSQNWKFRVSIVCAQVMHTCVQFRQVTLEHQPIIPLLIGHIHFISTYRQSAVRTSQSHHVTMFMWQSQWHQVFDLRMTAQNWSSKVKDFLYWKETNSHVIYPILKMYHLDNNANFVTLGRQWIKPNFQCTTLNWPWRCV